MDLNIRESLKYLTHREQKILSLLYFEEQRYSPKEIGQLFGVTGSAINHIKVRALAKLAKIQSSGIIRE
jgi:DNA-directed RNA polymerase specialized sigma subunit